MPTTEADVVLLLDLLASCDVVPVVAGGWGVDALVGHQTRLHRDLDLLLPAEVLDEIVAMLFVEGFVSHEDVLPVRIELSDPRSDRHVDLHPTHDDGAGGCWQHLPNGGRYEHPATDIGHGRIGARTVRCLTATAQLDVHTGYELRPADQHDLAALTPLHQRAPRPDQASDTTVDDRRLA